MSDPTFTTPPDAPSRASPSTFSSRTDAFLAWMVTFKDELSTAVSWFSSTAATVSAAATTTVAASEAAVGAANYQGDYDAGTLYTIGQSVSYGGSVFAKKSTAAAGTTPVEGADWLAFGSDDSVAALTPAATVDIDISTANYFTLTPNVNTTFTLSNTTAVDSFTLALTGGGESGFALGRASYDSVSFSVTSQDANPSSIAFNPDGTKMYMLGRSSDRVYQYTLSTGFDVSTASYDSVSFSVNAQESSPYGLAFNTDGTKMYMVGITNDRVYQYTLSTGFDVSTASYASLSFSVVGQESNSSAITFNTDGTKMYLSGVGNDSVHQYTLSTGFDVSTASYDSVSLSVASQDINPNDIAFNTDGTKMYMLGSTSDTVYEYNLSTGFDLSTASYASISFSVASQDTGATGLAFNADGTKMYVVGTDAKAVYQYSMTTGASLTYPAAVKWSGGIAPDTPGVGEIDVITAFTVDGGTTWYATLTGDALA